MHQNILAILYYITGVFTAFCFIFLAEEVYLKSLGVLILIYFTWLVVEQSNK